MFDLLTDSLLIDKEKRRAATFIPAIIPAGGGYFASSSSIHILRYLECSSPS
jgi:hypothetical protein